MSAASSSSRREVRRPVGVVIHASIAFANRFVARCATRSGSVARRTIASAECGPGCHCIAYTHAHAFPTHLHAFPMASPGLLASSTVIRPARHSAPPPRGRPQRVPRSAPRHATDAPGACHLCGVGAVDRSAGCLNGAVDSHVGHWLTFFGRRLSNADAEARHTAIFSIRGTNRNKPEHCSAMCRNISEHTPLGVFRVPHGCSGILF